MSRVAAAWVAAVIVLVIFQTVLPQATGFFALTEILEPYVVLSAVVAAPFVVLRRTRPAVVIVVVLGVVVAARYGGGFVSGSAGDAGVHVTVSAWNVEAGKDGGDRVANGLDGVTSDLVGLEELQPPMADALSNNLHVAAAYPYRALSPDSSVLGVGLISRYPIAEQWFSSTTQPRGTSAPPFLRAVVNPPNIPSLAVYVVHPLAGRFQSFLGVPYGIDTSIRDADIATIRTMIDADLAAHMPVIVMGDFNTTPREPAYQVFSQGMRDARSAGSWPGLTWRLDPLKGLPFGVLRIDYVLSTAQPVSYGVRCTPYSDHCVVSAELAFPNPPL